MARKLKAYRGPPVFSAAFRPFHLGGALWAGAAVALSIPMLTGAVTIPTAFGVVEWHVHELLYGYVPAIVAGNLLTLIPSWTGRSLIAGTPLAILCAIWLAGRAAVAVSAITGPAFAAAVDISFLFALGMVAGYELVAGKNYRNLRVVAHVALLGAGNVVFHIEAAAHSTGGYGARIGISAAVLLIVLVSGRIVPYFTKQWLAGNRPDILPGPAARFDFAATAIPAIALVFWVAAPKSAPTAALCALASITQLIRLAGWRGHRTLSEPMLAIQHIGYAFVPLGFLLTALAAAFPEAIPPGAGIHAWTIGAIGLKMLAVVIRVCLGYTGRPITASRWVVAIFLSGGVASVAGIVAAFVAQPQSPILYASALAWFIAFWGFSALFAPMLLKRSWSQG